jgi:hypothetical protein
MSIGSLATEPAHGYLSESSKRRFTLVAGILGAVLFLAQFLLPMLVMFLVMMPMMFESAASMADLDQAGLWRGELWFIERTAKVNWRDPGNSTSLSALRHMSLKDLASAGPAIPLDFEGGSGGPSCRWGSPLGDRSRQDLLQNGVLTRLSGAGRAARSSRPFAYQGRPAVISLGAHPSLATLQEEGARAVWTAKDLPLNLPAESGSLRTLQAVESKGGLYLFAELCTDDPDHCSISYREPDQGAWLPLVEDSCSCATWTALPSESLLTVVLSERAETRETLSVITLTADGRRKPSSCLERSA